MLKSEENSSHFIPVFDAIRLFLAFKKYYNSCYVFCISFTLQPRPHADKMYIIYIF